MAISDELKAQILRYHFVEHWRVGTIASQLGIHHYTVERVLSEAGVERERQRQRRASKLDPYLALITETLERFPTLTAARLFDMVKARGYESFTAIGRLSRWRHAHCPGANQPSPHIARDLNHPLASQGHRHRFRGVTSVSQQQIRGSSPPRRRAPRPRRIPPCHLAPNAPSVCPPALRELAPSEVMRYVLPC